MSGVMAIAYMAMAPWVVPSWEWSVFPSMNVYSLLTLTQDAHRSIATKYKLWPIKTDLTH